MKSKTKIAAAGSAAVVSLGVLGNITSLYDWTYAKLNPQADTRPAPVAAPAAAPAVAPPVAHDKVYTELANATLAEKYVGQEVSVPVQFLGLAPSTGGLLAQYLPKGQVLIAHFNPGAPLPTAPFGGGATGFGLVPPFSIAAPADMADKLIALKTPAEIQVRGKFLKIDPLKAQGIVGHPMMYLAASGFEPR